MILAINEIARRSICEEPQTRGSALPDNDGRTVKPGRGSKPAPVAACQREKMSVIPAQPRS